MFAKDFESLDAIWQSEQVRTAVEQECGFFKSGHAVGPGAS